MNGLAYLFVEASLVQNLALSFLLGICTLLGVSKRLGTAIGVGVAVLAVQTITLPLNHLVYTYLLKPGAWRWAGLPDVDLSFLHLISFIGLIAATVQILEMTLQRFFPTLQQALGIFLPLITVNCAILGGSLFMVERHYDFGESLVYGAGTGVGWLLAIALLAAIREKLRYSDPPNGLRGTPLAFVVVGMMALGFLAFSGLEVA